MAAVCWAHGCGSRDLRIWLDRDLSIADFRIMPSETVTQVIEHVRDAIDDPDVIVEQVDLANEPSRISDIGSWSFEALHKTVRQVFPDVVVAPSLVIGGTDSKHYAVKGAGKPADGGAVRRHR